MKKSIKLVLWDFMKFVTRTLLIDLCISGTIRKLSIMENSALILIGIKTYGKIQK